MGSATMIRRTITALLLLILILPVTYFGGLLYFLYVCVFVVGAALEYVQMFRGRDFEPSPLIVVGGVFLLLLIRSFWPAWAIPAFTGLILLAMTVHVFSYERGRDSAALDFVITAAGLAYLGWAAGYMLDLRALPQGGWWTLFVFPIVWLADSGAYAIGARYGKHKMFARISPKKSWEGYLAGLFIGTLYGGFFAFAYTRFGPLHVNIGQGLLLGFVLSTVTTLGDLGESLFKRFANAKDSGNFLPGHGGAFDRIDSLIWAAVIGVIWIRSFLL
jgi:phosphatidate cytidylyltransferase